MPAGDASSALPPQPQGGMPDPMMGGGEPAMDMNAGAPAGGEGEIQGMYDGLNPQHQKAAKRYIQSLEDQETEEGQAGGQMDGAMPEAPAQGQAPMQESVKFTKKQLRKINEGISQMDDETDRKIEPVHTTKTNDNNKKVTPFDPPKKNMK